MSDAPAWIAAGVAGVALIVSIWAAGTSAKAVKWEKLSAEAALRSAEAAERADLRAERAERAVTQRIQPNGIASEEAFGVPTVGRVLNVSWRIEGPNGNRYVLRNTGTDIAEHVEVDASRAGPVSRNLPEDAVVRPGEGANMMLLGTWQHPLPPQLYVRWAGQPDWIAVPIP